MHQEVVLAMLAKEPSQAYQLRARFDGPSAPWARPSMMARSYVTLGRLEKAGLVTRREAGAAVADRKVYESHPCRPGAGDRVAE